MFNEPVPRPPKANVLNLLWTYLIKAEGTKKVRCVCNGNPRNKGTVTLAHTFAACLEQPGARTFWATAAIKGMIVSGCIQRICGSTAPEATTIRGSRPTIPRMVEEQGKRWHWERLGPTSEVRAIRPSRVSKTMGGYACGFTTVQTRIMPVSRVRRRQASLISSSSRRFRGGTWGRQHIR